MESETLLRLSAFFGVLICMALLELLIPKRPLTAPKPARWFANLGIVALNTLALRLLLPVTAIGAASFANMHGWGLLNILSLHSITALLLAIVLLDLAIYAQHLLFHAMPILWRLHMVHHADHDIDVTTGLRFHPIEILLSMLIKIGVVIAIGAPMEAVLLFEIVLNGMAMFNHANIHLPAKLDRLLRLFIVTPDMHRVHHSEEKHETNSNYGFNLSVWDRLFGTYTPQPELGHTGMRIGLTQFHSANTHTLRWMLSAPFTANIGTYPILKKSEGPDL